MKFVVNCTKWFGRRWHNRQMDECQTQGKKCCSHIPLPWRKWCSKFVVNSSKWFERRWHDRQMKGYMDSWTDGGIYNIPIAFLKKLGDKKTLSGTMSQIRTVKRWIFFLFLCDIKHIKSHLLIAIMLADMKWRNIVLFFYFNRWQFSWNSSNYCGE